MILLGFNLLGGNQENSQDAKMLFECSITGEEQVSFYHFIIRFVYKDSQFLQFTCGSNLIIGWSYFLVDYQCRTYLPQINKR